MEAGMVTPAPALVRFSGIQKTYDGEFLVVKNLDLDIRKGEFITLLGPSGSGKTTTLMMLAGFEVPTHGEIYLADRPIKNVPPHKRDIGMVFQNYALFPHLTIAENIAFPLSVRNTNKAETQERVKAALRMIKMETLAQRRPGQLSGGQQQRVALARALVFNPQLVLMDEPLGALDKRLREQMQLEIKQLHETMGITVVYVTHDQSEALTMSDRIAVFNDGIVQQIDRPDALYEHPVNSFVAHFIGENNVLAGTVETIEKEYCRVALAGGGRRDRTGDQCIRRWRIDLPVGAAGANRHCLGWHLQRGAEPAARQGAEHDISRRPRAGRARGRRQPRVHGQASTGGA
ncbi:putative spermidine/putrescine transport system ATP-binding protein [Bradyrhizobium sp. LB7.1]